MKALYLDGSGGLDVRLDGPALRAHRPGRADGQFPLQRIARVIAVGAVQWQPDALSACLREHKPVAVLDTQGRFVRVLFDRSGPQFGLARHVGELLEVARFRARYEGWLCVAERAETMAAVGRLRIGCRDLQPDKLWQIVCLAQHRRWHIRVGGSYRYLLGLAAAQIASALLLIGLPREPRYWGQGEYRLFCDLLRLERWRQIVLLEQLLEGRAQKPGRRELTAVFERSSEERERRLVAWRQRALLAMMGVRLDEQEPPLLEQPDPQLLPLDKLSPALGWRFNQTPHNRLGNSSRTPFRAGGSVRSNVWILRQPRRTQPENA